MARSSFTKPRAPCASARENAGIRRSKSVVFSQADRKDDGFHAVKEKFSLKSKRGLIVEQACPPGFPLKSQLTHKIDLFFPHQSGLLAKHIQFLDHVCP